MPDASALRDILNGLITRAKNAAKEAIIPPCYACGERRCPPFPCISCGGFSCVDHGFFRVSSMSSICYACSENLDTDQDYPWSVLLTKKEIKNAFRQRSKEAHPDKQGGDPHEFSEIQQAYQEALHRAENWSDE